MHFVVPLEFHFLVKFIWPDPRLNDLERVVDSGSGIILLLEYNYGDTLNQIIIWTNQEQRMIMSNMTQSFYSDK